MVLIAADRRGPKPALEGQVLEEIWEQISERLRSMRTTAPHKAGNNKRQHLLDQATDLLGELRPGRVVPASTALALGH